MSKALETPQAKAFKVLDAEKDSWVEIGPEQHKTAVQLQRQLELGTLIQAMTLKQIFDQRAYIALGFTSKIDYINNALPFSQPHAYKLYRIADTFQSIYPELSTTASMQQLTAGEETTASMQQSTKDKEIAASMQQSSKEESWGSLGITKLYEITKLSGENMETALQEGKLTTPDGRELTIDDLKDMSVKAVNEEIKKIRGKYSGKVAAQDEEIKTLKQQLNMLKKNSGKAQEELDMFRDKWGPAAVEFKHKDKALDDAAEHLNAFYAAITRADMAIEDPEPLKAKLRGIVGNFNTYWVDDIFPKHKFVMDSFPEDAVRGLADD